MHPINEKRIKFLKFLFIAFSIFIFFVITFLVSAITFYPGGNFINNLEHGYSFLYNTMCDLKGITAINGASNLLSSVFIKTSTILACISMIIFFSTIWVFFQNTKTMKYLSWIASLFGINFGPFYLAIIFIKTEYEFHMAFDAIAGLTLNISVIMYTILYFMQKNIPLINRYTFLVLSISSITYSIIVTTSTVLGGQFNLFVHRLGSNLFIIFSFGIFLFQGIGLSFEKNKKYEAMIHI